MWWVKDHPDHSRGGFQNRDVGKSNFDQNYGPDYGVDYARFSDAPDVAADLKVLENVLELMKYEFTNEVQNMDIIVRNGFVILKGETGSDFLRQKIVKKLRSTQGVREVINQLMLRQ